MDEGGEQFSQAIEQVVDQLSFACTHISDNDFRVHSKTTAETVASLQDEQKNRIALAFGGKKATPEYLSSQLMSIYHADAASVAATNKAGSASTFNAMSDDAVKYFKKEMKQRIHEWEGSFQDAYGRDPSPQDKAALRPIYELYKVVKNRAQGGPAAAAAPASNNQSVVTSSSAGGASPAAAVSNSAQHSHQQQQHQQPAAVAASPSTSSVKPAAPPSTNPPSFTRVSTTHPAEEQGDQLVSEKRSLKRQLHQFEAEFEGQYGRKPGKEDRKARAKEYQRYGELKLLLNEHAKGNET